MKTEKNILIAFLLNISFSLFEFFGGIFTKSVAIMSDAIHDFGDALDTALQSCPADKRSENDYHSHPERKLIRVSEQSAEERAYCVGVEAVELSCVGVVSVGNHPAIYDGVEHHENVIPHPADVAPKRPDFMLWTKDGE